MSLGEENCLFCGGEIAFRKINGITVPIHTGESGCVGKKLYRNDQEGIPHPTTCPRCQADVIFLRHNGGCVWLESLGWPWPKHQCFDADNQVAKNKDVSRLFSQDLEGGRIKFARVVGRLTSSNGFVIVLCDERKELRCDDRNLGQWKVHCIPERVAEYAQKIGGTTVLANQRHLLTLDGERFVISRHSPNYPRRSSFQD